MNYTQDRSFFRNDLELTSSDEQNILNKGYIAVNYINQLINFMHELVDKFEKIFSQTGITSINNPLESETTSNYSPLLHDIQKSEMKNVTYSIEKSFFVIHLLVVLKKSVKNLIQ